MLFFRSRSSQQSHYNQDEQRWKHAGVLENAQRGNRTRALETRSGEIALVCA